MKDFSKVRLTSMHIISVSELPEQNNWLGYINKDECLRLTHHNVAEPALLYEAAAMLRPEFGCPLANQIFIKDFCQHHKISVYDLGISVGIEL